MLIVLPFLGIFSLNLRKGLHKSVSKLLPQHNIKVIFQPKCQLNNLFKEPILLYLHSHLIYKFQCSNCNITHNAETERHLKVRPSEHIIVSPLTGKNSTTTKIFPLKITSFCQVTCVHLIISLSCIMSHTSLNGWLKNLYLLTCSLLNKQLKSLKLKLFWFNSTYAIFY